jgi:anti-sigma regulatory factor (Ser/Thr protein kinase)
MRNRGYESRVVDDAALAVSELASNAVRHAASGFSLTLRVRASTLRVAVTDHQPLPDGVPAWSVSPDQLHGLGLIEAISTSWGVAPTADGKVVWARLASSNA